MRTLNGPGPYPTHGSRADVLYAVTIRNSKLEGTNLAVRIKTMRGRGEVWIIRLYVCIQYCGKIIILW